MYIFKNALKNIIRSKGRNVLVGIVIIIISATSAIALSIKNSAEEIVSSYEESNEITASLVINREALRTLMMEEQQDIQGSMRDLIAGIDAPGIEDISDYGVSQFVDHYTYSISISMDSQDINPLTNDENSADDQITPGSGQSTPGGGSAFPVTRGDFSVTGYSSMDAMARFVSGDYVVSEGSMFNGNETQPVCVISDELAVYNDLSVGDTLTLNKTENTEDIYIFTIVGVYKDNTVSDSEINWFSGSANQIIAAVLPLTDIAGPDGQISATFYLYDSSDLEALETEMKEKGLNEYYMLSVNESLLEQTLKPLTNLNKFAGIFLLMVLFVGGVILLILNMINVRERKYEIGVLRAIGMKKSKLAAQFVIELLVITFVSLIIGTAAGAVASVPTAQMMLQNEIDSIQDEQQKIDENFGMAPGAGGGRLGGGGRAGGRELLGGAFDTGANISYVSRINAVIDPGVVLKLIMIGLILTFLASLVSVVLISKYEPLRILSGRSS